MTTESALQHRNVTPEAMLRHVRVVTKDNTVQLWMGDTHIANVEPDSIPAIALQSFAADQPLALARSSSASVRGMREVVASPKLLEACKAAEEWLSGWASASPYIEVIRAAIREAEGPDEVGEQMRAEASQHHNPLQGKE